MIAINALHAACCGVMESFRANQPHYLLSIEADDDPSLGIRNACSKYVETNTSPTPSCAAHWMVLPACHQMEPALHFSFCVTLPNWY
jgi:hypothetical protein